MTSPADLRGVRAGAALLLASVLAACVGAPAPRSSAALRAAAPALPPPAAAARAAIPADADRRFKAALALMQAQQPEDAVQAFAALARDFPALSGALTNLGILHAQARDRDAALRSFASAVEANPGNAVALNWLGVLYRESGDYARAEQAYRRALAVQPGYADAQLNLGILYELYLRRPQDAIAAYRGYRAAGGPDLIVEAWIRELEARHGIETAHSGATP
ncbi:tetratricopeptide repeat protein [Fontimonas sp. SYSU GA230001]|uniref:tetratricopeptide repeat protein n=1 Tax=Fontimonas sp. SYSU GA230001 TaxID=3142450 RepID=UPI0032B4B5A3